MKALPTLGLCLLFSLQLAAQNGKTTPRKAATPGLDADRLKMLCHSWKLDSVSRFAVAHKASAKEANDAVAFTADGTYTITSEGATSNGTWKGNGNPYLYFTSGTPATTIYYKLMSVSNNRLVLEYQDEDQIRIDYIYSPKH